MKSSEILNFHYIDRFDDFFPNLEKSLLQEFGELLILKSVFYSYSGGLPNIEIIETINELTNQQLCITQY